MGKLLSLLEDENGTISMMRVMGVIFALSFIVEWQRAIWLGQVYTPDWNTVIMTLGTFGFKVVQKPFEKAKPVAKPK